MKYGITLLLNMALSLNALLGAQEIDGKWTTFQYLEEGKIEVVYDLQTDGEILTGKVSTEGNEYKIENGLVNGSTVSFMIKFGEISVYHTGYLLRGKLLISTRYEGNTAEFTLTKSAEVIVLQ